VFLADDVGKTLRAVFSGYDLVCHKILNSRCWILS
jgi:hypothetical protein